MTFRRHHDDDGQVIAAIHELKGILMSSFANLQDSVASLTAIDTELRTAVDSLVVLVGTLQAGAGSLTPDQQAALDASVTAIDAITASDTASDAAVDAANPPVVAP